MSMNLSGLNFLEELADTRLGAVVSELRVIGLPPMAGIMRMSLSRR